MKVLKKFPTAKPVAISITKSKAFRPFSRRSPGKHKLCVSFRHEVGYNCIQIAPIIPGDVEVKCDSVRVTLHGTVHVRYKC